jgi:hypothetical protein
METRRWINQSQPQTLVIAVWLFYFDAVFLAVLRGGLFSLFGILLIAGYVASGYGIANERKWGYVLGLIFAVLGVYPYVNAFLTGHNVIMSDPLGLMFAVARLALLAHPQSREYQRIWFK